MRWACRNEQAEVVIKNKGTRSFIYVNLVTLCNLWQIFYTSILA